MGKKYCLLFIIMVVATACSLYEEEMLDHSQSEQNENEAAPTEEIEPARLITLSFAGDTMAAGSVASSLEKNGYQYLWKQAKPYLEESDIAMVNLETPVGSKGEASNKTYTYQSHPNLLKGMKWAGVDIVTIANNHSLDYGIEAFKDTLDNLSEKGITYVGGGLDEEEAYQAKDITVKGKTISFLGFSRVLPSVSWYADKNQPGLASGYQNERVYEHVEQAVNDSDITVVYMHWGEELADGPKLEDRGIAHHLIDLGVDLVIGSHPHVLQGFEYYKGKLIAYSLGNFIFTKSHQEIARQSAVLQVAINGDSTQSARLYPMKIDYGSVWLADDQETKEILKRLSSLSIGGKWTEHGEFLPVN